MPYDKSLLLKADNWYERF